MQNSSRTEKALASLAYIPFLVFFSLAVERKKKSSDFLLFHVNRGFVLFIIECALFLPLSIVARLLSDFWDPIGTVALILIFLLVLVFAVLSLCGIIYALRGQKRVIPLFGECAPFKSNTTT